MSWMGRPGTTVCVAGSSAVTNIGATTRYWLGASPRKYVSGVCISKAARSARLSGWSTAPSWSTYVNSAPASWKLSAYGSVKDV